MRLFPFTTAALLLCALLPAQTGSYTVFGSGCIGTGNILKCPNANGTATAPFKNNHNTNIFAVEVTTTSNDIVLGMEFLTASKSGSPVTIPIEFYRQDSKGAPLSKPTTTGTMTIGTADGWYRGMFNTPQVVKSGAKFFLSYKPNTSMKWPWLFPPSAGTVVPHWELKSTGWVGPLKQVPWCWRLVCANGMVAPKTGGTGVPKINATFSIDLANARLNATAVLILGGSNTTWNGTRLPLNLSNFGAGGCSLLASQDFLLFTQTTAGGTASIKLPIPNNQSLVDAKAYNQWAVFDLGANAWGLAFSNGGAIKVGK